MFKSRNKLFVILLAALVFFLTPTFSLAAGDTAATPFVIEDIGIMSIGGKWRAVSVEEVLTRLDKFIAENPVVKKQVDDSTKAVESATKPSDSAAQPVKKTMTFVQAKDMLLQQLEANNIKIYQLAVDSNNTYYTSYLIFFKEKNPISENTLKFFAKNSTKEDKKIFAEQMKDFQGFVAQITKSIPQTYQTYFNAEALPVAQPEIVTVKDLPAYGFESRVAFDIAGLISPAYAKTYVFNLDGYQTYAILCSVDSERHFWNKTFESMITSLK